MIVVRHGRRINALERQLGQGIGILEILVAEILERPGMFTVIPDDVLRDFRHDVQRVIPGYRHQDVVYPNHRIFQTIMRRVRRVVDFLGDASAANTVVAGKVDHFGFMVRNDSNVVQPAVVDCLGELIRPDPTAFLGSQRKVPV